MPAKATVRRFFRRPKVWKIDALQPFCCEDAVYSLYCARHYYNQAAKNADLNKNDRGLS